MMEGFIPISMVEEIKQRRHNSKALERPGESIDVD